MERLNRKLGNGDNDDRGNSSSSGDSVGSSSGNSSRGGSCSGADYRRVVVMVAVEAVELTTGRVGGGS